MTPIVTNTPALLVTIADPVNLYHPALLLYIYSIRYLRDIEWQRQPNRVMEPDTTGIAS